MRLASVSLAVAGLAMSGAAQAADPIPLSAICDRPSDAAPDEPMTVNPILLQYHLLKGVAPITLDRDANGSTPTDAFAALTDSGYCTMNARFACAKGDSDKLRMARNTLSTFETEHPGIEFRFKRAPTAEETQKERGLEDRFTWTADPQRRFIVMVCQPASPSPLPAGPAQTIAGDSEAPSLNLGTFLFTKDIAGLTASRGKPGDRDRLKNVPQAEISFIDDDAKNRETLAVSATAGLKIIDTGRLALIPFIQFNRSHVDDTSAANADKDTGKLAVGALVTAFVTMDDQVDFAPLYVKDLETDAEIIGGRLSWRPGFLYNVDSFRRAFPLLCKREADGSCTYGTTTLALRTDFQVISSFGKVLEEGTDPKVTDGREFLRVGPDMRAVLFGLRGPFRDFSLDVAYRRLFRLAGDGEDVTQFRAGLSYWIAGSEHVALRYGYERGTDEETLERFDLWRLGIGVRF